MSMRPRPMDASKMSLLVLLKTGRDDRRGSELRHCVESEEELQRWTSWMRMNKREREEEEGRDG